VRPFWWNGKRWKGKKIDGQKRRNGIVKDTKRWSRRCGSEGIRGGGLPWAHTGLINN